MSKKIRDVVHNYIYLSPIEELVTENPLFLRLHYIHQNSFAYLTYPSAHNTRFSHSLGVMHVAGSIFQAAFQRSRSEVVEQLMGCADREFIRLFPQGSKVGSDAMTLNAVVEELVQQSDFLRNAVYAPFLDARPLEKLTPDEKKMTALTLICVQGIRLAAMLHDVGHPPFSHIVEYALLEGLQQRTAAGLKPTMSYQGHEHASQEIAKLVLGPDSLLAHRFAGRFPLFFTACAAFAQGLFDKKSALGGLTAGILSGDVDADRLDYVLRDAKSAGMSIDYDIERLLDAAYLDFVKGRVTVAYKISALSVIERFFDARYELYRWMIYHHDTTRRNLVVQRLIISLLNSANLSPELAAVGVSLGEQAAGISTIPHQSPYENYKRFLDSTFVEMLWRVHDTIAAKRQPTDAEQEIKQLLDVVLSRSNHLLPSVSKSPAEYAELANCAVEVANWPKQTGEKSVAVSSEPIILLNDRLQQKFRGWVERVASEDGYRNVPEQDLRGVAKYRMSVEMEAAIQKAVDEERGEKEFRCRAYYIGSFQAGLKEELFVSDGAWGADRFPVDALSPTITMLKTAWARSPQLMLYVGVNDETARKAANERPHVRAADVQGLRKIMGAALGRYLADV